MNDINEKLLTVEEFAELANVLPATVRAWIKNGVICAEKKRYAGFRFRWYINVNELKKVR